MENIPDFWNYDVDEETGQIYQNNNSITFLRLEKYLLYTRKEKINYVTSLINLTSSYKDKDIRIYIITYIYYLIYHSDLHLANKMFYQAIINKLIEIIKINYFKERKFSYKIMKNFKQIYYLLTGVYICEYINCNRDCCDKNNTLCSIHIRNKNKQAKYIEYITNVPLDVCKLITEY